MGRVIRGQRRGSQVGVFKTHNAKRLANPRFRHLDYSEREGYVKGMVKDIMHDPGRGAPLCKVMFHDPYKYRQNTNYFICAEGMYSGQYIYCGAKAQLATGNVLPLNQIPEGTVICNVEENPGDKGHISRASGAFCQIVGHSEDGSKTRIKLPSGQRRTMKGNARAMIGVIAGGGRNEKPILKAGVKYHMYRVKRRKVWPRIRGVAMNPVDHPHGGGNHQHIGIANTIKRSTSHGRKVGLIAARRSGILRGGKPAKVTKDSKEI